MDRQAEDTLTIVGIDHGFSFPLRYFETRHAVVEVYAVLWKHAYAIESRTGDQHDAYVVARWLREVDRDGRLRAALGPNLSAR